MDGYLGYVTLFAGNFAPANWAFCNGQILSIAQNQALFSILGKTYGGDGIQTFGLPNLQGKAVVGAGQSPFSLYTLGQSGGNATNVLGVTQLPPHLHTVSIESTYSCGGVANSASPENAAYAISSSNLYNYSANTNLQTYVAPVTIGTAGNNAPIPTLRPVVGLNYIICLAGYFPQKPGSE